MIHVRTPAMIAAALAVSTPVAAVSPKLNQALGQVRLALNKGCKLADWQVGLTPNAQNLTRVELSPTASAEQVQCTYQTLSDWNVALDRPSPVPVERKRVERVKSID